GRGGRVGGPVRPVRGRPGVAVGGPAGDATYRTPTPGRSPAGRRARVVFDGSWPPWAARSRRCVSVRIRRTHPRVAPTPEGGPATRRLPVTSTDQEATAPLVPPDTGPHWRRVLLKLS